MFYNFKYIYNVKVGAMETVASKLEDALHSQGNG